MNNEVIFIRYLGDVVTYAVLYNSDIIIQTTSKGMYSTEEKAMKVMDMIESAIIEHEIAKAKSKIIFYMPKDDEVDR